MDTAPPPEDWPGAEKLAGCSKGPDAAVRGERRQASARPLSGLTSYCGRWAFFSSRLPLAENDHHEKWMLGPLEHLVRLESKEPLDELEPPRQLDERP